MASVAKERDRYQNRPHDCGLLRGNTLDRPRSIGHLLHIHTWEGVLSHCTLPRDESESFKSAGGMSLHGSSHTEIHTDVAIRSGAAKSDLIGSRNQFRLATFLEGSIHLLEPSRRPF
jgi:hypothetical protein